MFKAKVFYSDLKVRNMFVKRFELALGVDNVFEKNTLCLRAKKI